MPPLQPQPLHLRNPRVHRAQRAVARSPQPPEIRVSEVQSSPEHDHDPVAAAPVVRRRRGRAALVLILLLLAAAAAAAGYVYFELQRARSAATDGEGWRREAEALNARLVALDRQLGQLDAGRRGLDERIGEVASNQRVIRQELLGMGERAATIEDAVARLSDQRLRGETTLKLNEIEGLLVLAEQRLQLARDPEGARTALRLAASALETLEDPLYAGLALPLRVELQLLQQLPADPLPQLREQLAAALAAAPTLPRRPLQSASVGADSRAPGRLQQALSELITVRRRGEASETLSGSAREAALEALQLDLRSALLAAEARDAQGVAAALARVQPLFERLFDPADARVLAITDGLQRLDVAALSPSLPALGTSLAELRSLRGSRQRLAPPAVDSLRAPADDAAAVIPPDGAQQPESAPELPEAAVQAAPAASSVSSSPAQPIEPSPEQIEQPELEQPEQPELERPTDEDDGR